VNTSRKWRRRDADIRSAAAAAAHSSISEQSSCATADRLACKCCCDLLSVSPSSSSVCVIVTARIVACPSCNCMLVIGGSLATPLSVHTGWPKMWHTFCTLYNFIKILTYFQTYFTVRIRRTFVIILSLKIPPHLATLWNVSVLKATIENKTTSVTTHFKSASSCSSVVSWC